MKQVLFGFNSTTTGTEYSSIMGVPLGWTTEAFARSPWPAPGVFRNLIVDLSAAPGVGQSRTFTVRKAGASTALTVTISDTATTARLTGVDVTVAVGDLVALETIATGSPASASVRWSLEFEGTTAKQSGYSQQIGNANTGDETTGVFAFPSSLTGANVTNLVAAAGTLSGMVAAVTAAPGVGNGFTFYINLNGVRHDGSGGTIDTACALVGAITSVTASYSLPLSPGDLVYTEAISSGTFTTRFWSLGVSFVATTDGESQLCGTTDLALSPTVTQFVPATGIGGALGATETAFANRFIGGVTSVGLRGLQVLLQTAPGVGTSRTVDLRVDGASPGPAVTITDTATTGSDLTGTGTIADGDLWNLRSVPTSSPAAALMNWGLIQRVGSSDTGFSVEVEGEGRDALLRTFEIKEVANGVNIVTLEIESVNESPLYRPELDDEIIVYDIALGPTVRRFAGIISGLHERGFAGPANDPIVTRIDAGDFSSYAERRYVTETIPAGTLKAALEVLVTYLTAYGVTLDPAQADGPTLEAILFDTERVDACLNRLSELTADPGPPYLWNIDYDAVLSMRQSGSEACPFNLIEGDGTELGDVEVSPSRQDYANTIVLVYGTNIVTMKTDCFVGDGVTDTFPLTYSIAGPIAYGDGTGAVGYAVVDHLVFESLGGLLSPPDLYWEYDPVALTIKRRAAFGGAPANGEPFCIRYDVQFPQTVTVSNLASPGEPLWEKRLTAPTIYDKAEAEAYATAQLERAQGILQTVTYKTFETGARPGQVQTITVPKRNLSGSYLISEVVTRAIVARGEVESTITAQGGDLFHGSFRDLYKAWLADETGTISAAAGIPPAGSAGGIALTGDVTKPANSTETTLTDTAVTPGSYGDATHVAQVTVNSQGRLTLATDVLITGGGGSTWEDGYWIPISNQDPLSPEILFDSTGTVVVGFVPTP